MATSEGLVTLGKCLQLQLSAFAFALSPVAVCGHVEEGPEDSIDSIKQQVE
jgi:hypothetical protein